MKQALEKESLKTISYLRKSPQGNTYLLKDADNTLFVKKTGPVDLFPIYETLKPLKIRGLPRVLSVEKTTNGVEVIYQYIEGEDLATLLKEGHKFSEQEAVDIVRQITLILSEVHKFGMIHRDVTPNNIIIDSDGGVHLIDFDISRFYDEKKNLDTQLLGTPGYAAPEQLGLCQTTLQSDIFAIGQVFKLLLTGNNTMTFTYPNKEISRIISLCTAMDREARYESTLQLDFDLRSLTEKYNGAPTPTKEIQSSGLKSAEAKPSHVCKVLHNCTLGATGFLALGSVIMALFSFDEPFVMVAFLSAGTWFAIWYFFRKKREVGKESNRKFILQLFMEILLGSITTFFAFGTFYSVGYGDSTGVALGALYLGITAFFGFFFIKRLKKGKIMIG